MSIKWHRGFDGINDYSYMLGIERNNDTNLV